MLEGKGVFIIIHHLLFIEYTKLPLLGYKFSSENCPHYKFSFGTIPTASSV